MTRIALSATINAQKELGLANDSNGVPCTQCPSLHDLTVHSAQAMSPQLGRVYPIQGIGTESARELFVSKTDAHARLSTAAPDAALPTVAL